MIHLPQLPTAGRRSAAPLRLPAVFQPPSGAEFVDRLADLRARFGVGAWITPPDGNLKLARGGLAAGLTLAPASEGGVNVCARSTEGCRKACVLWHAGHGHRDSVRRARVARTQALAADPQAALEAIRRELEAMADRRTDPIEAVRLNVASDLPWERVAGFLEALPPRLGLYDYTKIRARIGEDGQARGAARPYRLAYSISEHRRSVDEASSVLEANGTAVLVVAGLRRRQADGTLAYHAMPREARIGGRWWSVVSGDRTDRRDLDPLGVVVALAGKGRLELPGAGGDRIGERFAAAIDSPDLRWSRRIAAAWRR